MKNDKINEMDNLPSRYILTIKPKEYLHHDQAIVEYIA